MRTNAIAVLLVDDHPMVLTGIRRMLEAVDDVQVVGEATSASEAMHELAVRHIDVALIDISLPDENGLDLIRRFKQAAPHVAVLVLSGYGEDMYAMRALRAGADGYLTKGAALNELVAAVRKIDNGGKHFSAFLNDLLIRHVQQGEVEEHCRLSSREFDIMMRLVGGASNNSIAAALHRSPKTISTHRSRLFEKLNIRSIAELARYAIEQGLIGPTITK